MAVAEDTEPLGADTMLMVGDLRYGIAFLRLCDFDLLHCRRHLEANAVIAQEVLVWYRGDIEVAMDTLKEVRSIVRHVQQFLMSPLRVLDKRDAERTSVIQKPAAAALRPIPET